MPRRTLMKLPIQVGWKCGAGRDCGTAPMALVRIRCSCSVSALECRAS